MKTNGMLKLILVPTDGSASSLTAEETAALIAKKSGAAVTLLHVMEDALTYEQIPKNVEDELLDEVEQRSKAIVNDARSLFAEENVKVKAETKQSSDVAKTILEYSKENCDLVVMGAQGENGKTSYIGSVTRKVMTQATCPVLITKKPSLLSKMLVCVDGSKSSIKALEFAAGLANAMSSKMTLLHVQERRLQKTSPAVAKQLGERVLTQAAGAVEKRQLKIDKKLEVGVAPDTIVDIAEKGKHDIIIVGSRGLGATKRFLLGSVSGDVVQKARCSVIIVP